MASIREMSSEEAELHDYKQNLESKKKDRAIIREARQGMLAEKQEIRNKRVAKVKGVAKTIFGGLGRMGKSVASGGGGIGNHLFGSPSARRKKKRKYKGVESGYNNSDSLGYGWGNDFDMGLLAWGTPPAENKPKKRKPKNRGGNFGGFDLGFDLGF